MNTIANIFNYIEMLKLEHNEVNHIAEQDFTLDELKEFEHFVYTLGTAYNAGKSFEEKHSNFMRYTNNYERVYDRMSLEDLEREGDWLDEEFFTLKIIVEDMALMLVLDGIAGGFFSEVRR